MSGAAARAAPSRTSDSGLFIVTADNPLRFTAAEQRAIDALHLSAEQLLFVCNRYLTQLTTGLSPSEALPGQHIAALPEELSEPFKPIVVNFESDPLEQEFATVWDDHALGASRSQGGAPSERAISGRYLSELFRALMPTHLPAPQRAEELAVLAYGRESETQLMARNVAQALFGRSADLVAARYAAFALMYGHGTDLIIQPEESLIGKVTGYRQRVESTVRELLEGTGCSVTLNPTEERGGKNAALGEMTVAVVQQPAERNTPGADERSDRLQEHAIELLEAGGPRDGGPATSLRLGLDNCLHHRHGPIGEALAPYQQFILGLEPRTTDGRKGIDVVINPFGPPIESDRMQQLLCMLNGLGTGVLFGLSTSPLWYHHREFLSSRWRQIEDQVLGVQIPVLLTLVRRISRG